MPEELEQDWEFKILRSTTGAFRRRESMQRALEEEAPAGWILLEKLDDSRLRLKRRRPSGPDDRSASVDPYRSHFGMGPGQTTAVIVMAVLLLVALALSIVFRFTA